VAAKFISERNLKFLLYEVFDVESLTKYEYYKEHNRKMFDMVLKAAVKLGKDLLFPVFEEMDRNQPELVNGEVKVHASVKTIMKEFGEGGWISIFLQKKAFLSVLPSETGGRIRRMVVRRSIEIRAPSAMGFQYSKAVANLFHDGPQTIGQAKPMRLESIESLSDASRSL